MTISQNVIAKACGILAVAVPISIVPTKSFGWSGICSISNASFVVPGEPTKGTFTSPNVFYVKTRASITVHSESPYIDVNITITKNTDGTVRYVMRGNQYPEYRNAWLTNDETISYTVYDKYNHPLAEGIVGCFHLHGKWASGQPITGSQGAYKLSVPFEDISGVLLRGKSFRAVNNDDSCHDDRRLVRKG